MTAASFIKRHIHRLEPGEIFTTRDCLSYGTRAAVDQTLYRLVKRGYIERLAFGVFIKPDPSGRTVVSALVVARVKAESFGKKLISHARDAACKLGMASPGKELSFAISGSSSSFRFGDDVIRMRQTSQKKIIVGDKDVGVVIRALCYLGKAVCTRSVIAAATAQLDRAGRAELRMRGSFMPAWLYNYFARRFTWTKRDNDQSLPEIA